MHYQMVTVCLSDNSQLPRKYSFEIIASLANTRQQTINALNEKRQTDKQLNGQLPSLATKCRGNALLKSLHPVSRDQMPRKCSFENIASHLSRPNAAEMLF